MNGIINQIKRADCLRYDDFTFDDLLEAISCIETGLCNDFGFMTPVFSEELKRKNGFK